MGNTVSKIFRYFFPLPKARVVILGLNYSGKTTLLYQISQQMQVQTIPTIGFNLEEIDVNGIRLVLFDVGGGDKIHALWHHYFDSGTCIVYVVDASDRTDEGISTSKAEFYNFIVDREESRGQPLLILANKQDKENAMSPQEIEKYFELNEKLVGRIWKVMPSCAFTREGTSEIIAWVREHVSS